MKSQPAARTLLLFASLSVAFVAVPLLFWHASWFGRPLSEAELGRYLDDNQRARRIQHVLSQISDRIVAGDATVRRWYPKIVALRRHPQVPVRATAAWVMGQDNRHEEFHAALLEMLEDPELMVRRNAALALVRFGDPSGRAEIVGMLEPHGVQTPAAGKVFHKVEVGQEVGARTLLARVSSGPGSEVEIRAPFSGRLVRRLVPDGAVVSRGQTLMSLSAEPGQVWEALRGLYLIGEPEDLAAVESWSAATGQVPDDVRRQAVLAAQAIRSRSERASSR